MKWSFCDTYNVRKKRANEHQRDKVRVNIWPGKGVLELRYLHACSMRLCHQYTSGELIVDTSGQGRKENIDDEKKWHIICLGYLEAEDWGSNSLPLLCILSRYISCSFIGMFFVLGFRNLSSCISRDRSSYTLSMENISPLQPNRRL